MNSLILDGLLLDILVGGGGACKQIPALNYYLFKCLVSYRRLYRNTASVLCIRTIVFEVLIRRLTEWTEKLRLSLSEV
jgi:hypothetical protein